MDTFDAFYHRQFSSARFSCYFKFKTKRATSLQTPPRPRRSQASPLGTWTSSSPRPPRPSEDVPLPAASLPGRTQVRHHQVFLGFRPRAQPVVRAPPSVRPVPRETQPEDAEAGQRAAVGDAGGRQEDLRHKRRRRGCVLPGRMSFTKSKLASTWSLTFCVTARGKLRPSSPTGTQGP